MKEANKNLPWILVIGLGLGLANYFVGAWPSLGQSIVQHLAISLIIGYGIFLVIGGVRSSMSQLGVLPSYLILASGFALLAIVGTEFEAIVRSYVFGQGEYSLLDIGGGHAFNVVLTVIIGFATRYWEGLRLSKSSPDSEHKEIRPLAESPTSIPIKRGDTVSMQSLDAVVYFQAADNYSQLFDIDGKKRACNYSLASLEKKLGSEFVRVHRKYLINKDLISQVRTYDKGRFEITFDDKDGSSITSGSTYTEIVKELIKI